MKKAASIFLIIFLIASLLAGCTGNEPAPSPKIQTIKLFYADSDNNKFVVEERKITIDDKADLYTAAVEELLKGPTDKTLRANIPAGTKVYGTIRQNDAIIIDLGGFSGFPGEMAELFSIGSIVNTLTQFEGVNKVKILVEGEEFIGPSGEPLGFMTEYPLEP
jgi:germination protein M